MIANPSISTQSTLAPSRGSGDPANTFPGEAVPTPGASSMAPGGTSSSVAAYFDQAAATDADFLAEVDAATAAGADLALAVGLARPLSGYREYIAARGADSSPWSDRALVYMLRMGAGIIGGVMRARFGDLERQPRRPRGRPRKVSSPAKKKIA